MTIARQLLAAFSSGVLLFAVSTGNAKAGDSVKDPNAIIRALAPIEYLPEHQGRRPRPAIDLDIRFALNKAALAPDAQAQLDALGQALGSPKLKGKMVEIAGHTDATGPAAYNKALSLRRAEAVVAYLKSRFGIKQARLSVVGYGEERLKDPLLPAGAVNRRVEIAATGTVLRSMEAERESASGSWGNLLEDASGARNFLRRAEAQGTARVIVGLAAPLQDAAQAQGWRNLNDYIADLQDRAIDRLGWTNINDLVRFQYTPAMAMALDASRLRELLAGGAVAQVFEDQMHAASLAKSVPLIGLRRPREQGGAGRAVAILDTGVDSKHPFLAGKIVAEACFSAASTMRDRVIHSACPSGDLAEIGPGAARPCDPAYGCGHGTHVAGIVAGGNFEMSGVAPRASIVAVQVFSLVESPKGGKRVVAFTSDILRGLEWVYRNRERYKIASVNLSLGGGRFADTCDGGSPYTRILALLSRSDIAPVVASGNEGYSDSISSPACVSHAISVGATSYRDNVAAFSNSARFLDFLAPGATERKDGAYEGILSSVPGTGFRRFPGTSMAAPHVAGAFAVLKSAAPRATLWQMTQALRDTGRMIADPRNGVSVPRIQLNAAIERLQGVVARGKPAPNPTPAIPPKPAPKVYDGIRVYEGGKKADKPFKW